MKLERVSEHIWTVKPWFPVRVWLVTAADGVTLVDTGMPFMVAGITKAIEQLNAGPLQRILLTHGHRDHIGGVMKLLGIRMVPVFAHQAELPYIEGERPYPRRKKPEPGAPKGLVQPLAATGDGALATVAGLKPYFAPGHSPGHVVYHHEQDNVLLAGDVFMSKRGQLRPPSAFFSGDMATALQSCQVLAQLQPERLEVTHGDPVINPAAQLSAVLQNRTR